MVKMRCVVLIITLLLSAQSFGQNVRVLGYNDEYEKYRESRFFDYIHEDFDTTKLTWVADIQVEFDSVIPGMIGECFKVLKDKSNRYGGNAYKVLESDIYTAGEQKYISVRVYWLRMEDRNENLQLHRSHKVYLFGFLGYHQDLDGYDVAIQDQDYLVRALSYRVFVYPVKTNVEIQLGSKLRGAKTSFRVEKKMYPKFYYFKMVTGSFKNAWIDEYAMNYGFFLTEILQKDS